jgi:hypothetical protein
LVFIPLVLIALYVNQITTFTKETFKPFILGDKETTDKVEEKEVPEDIEEESVKDEDDDDSDDDDGSTKANDSDAIYHITLDAAPEEESPYAPIFGKWKFHTISRYFASSGTGKSILILLTTTPTTSLIRPLRKTIPYTITSPRFLSGIFCHHE